MYLFLFLALFIAIGVVLFAVQNAPIVTVTFLPFHFEGSLAFILVVVFTVGLITGVLITLPSILRKSIALREQKRKVKQLEEKITMESPIPFEAKEKEDIDPL